MYSKEGLSADSLQSLARALAQKGPYNLARDELLAILSDPKFPEQFGKTTGQSWATVEPKCLELFRQAKIDFAAPRDPKLDVLFQWCRAGDLAKVKDFLKRLSTDERTACLRAGDQGGRTLLHVAAKNLNQSISELLLHEGSKVNVRDKCLRTPLHNAALGGSQALGSVLLRAGAEPQSKDQNGREALHLACCSGSSRLVSMLLQKHNSVDTTDYSGRTPLAYAVWNQTDSQIEIMRLLHEAGANINKPDNSGRTPLLHAAEVLKLRCVPFLLKHGADADIEDKAGNSFRKLASRNEKLQKLQKAYGRQDPKALQKKLAKEAAQILKESESPLEGPMVTKWTRERLLGFLRTVQDEGVRTRLHLKKPGYFTGSWLEQCSTLLQFRQVLDQMEIGEAVLKVFNVLHPYPRSFPKPSLQAEATDAFFGEVWLSPKAPRQGQLPMQNTKELQQLKEQLARREAEIEALRREKSDLQGRIQQLQEDRSSAVSSGKQVRALELELEQKSELAEELREGVAKLESTMEEMELELARYKRNEANNKYDLQKLHGVIRAQKEEAAREKQRQVQNRRRIGKLVLEVLQRTDAAKEDKPGRQDKSDKQEKPKEVVLSDDHALLRLISRLQENPPGLQQRLEAVDRNKDGKINRLEFITFLQNLDVPEQDTLSLLRVAGYHTGRKELAIEEFKVVLRERPEVREAETGKLRDKLGRIVQQKYKEPDLFFNFLDADSSGTVTAAELKKGLIKHEIFLNALDLNNLVHLLDSDQDGNISLAEFKAYLRGEEPPEEQVEFEEELQDEVAGLAEQEEGGQEEASQPYESLDSGQISNGELDRRLNGMLEEEEFAGI